MPALTKHLHTCMCVVQRTATGGVLEDEDFAQAVARALLRRQRLGRHARRRRQQLLLVDEGHLLAGGESAEQCARLHSMPFFKTPSNNADAASIKQMPWSVSTTHEITAMLALAWYMVHGGSTFS